MVAQSVSIVACVVSALFALLTFSLSRGPGWRSLRLFAVCAACSSIFSLCNVPVTMPGASLPLVVWACRVTFAVAGLHGASWFAYTAAQAGRRMNKVERTVVIIGVVFAVASLVPNLVIVEGVTRTRTVPSLGWTYTDGVPTALGNVVMAFYTLAILYLAAIYVRERAWRHVIGLGGVVVGGVCDSLSAMGVLSLPYLLDVADILLMVWVGGALAQRVVRAAEQLEASSARLASMQDEMVKRERLAAIGEMAAVIAHEVRNPLAIIFTAAASLERADTHPRDRKELLRIVLEEAKRLRGMVSELLDLAHPRALKLQTVHVGALLEDAVNAACFSETTSAEIEDASEDVTVACDLELVRQAIINLVANALQAEGRKSAVRVSASLGPGFVEIAVIDDGAGVAPDIQDKIFLPFFTTRPRGTGLGLSLVQRVAEAHNGSVQLERTEGGGATFRLRLPRGGAREKSARDLSSASFRAARRERSSIAE